MILTIGFSLQPIDLDGRELPGDLVEHAREVPRGQVPGQHGPAAAVPWTRPERVAQQLHALGDDGVGLPGDDFVRPRLVLEILQHVGAEDRPDDPGADEEVDLQAVAASVALVEAVLRHQEQTERFESDVAQRQLVALVILAETARAAGAGGQINVAPGDFIRADVRSPGVEEGREVAGGEAGGTALTDIGELAPEVQVLACCRREALRAIPGVLEHRLDDALDAPVQAAEQDRDVRTFGPREGTRNIGLVRTRGFHRPVFIHAWRA